MTAKPPKTPKPKSTLIAITVPPTLLARIDARATLLGLSRASYLKMIAQQDVLANPPSHSDPADFDVTFEVVEPTSTNGEAA